VGKYRREATPHPDANFFDMSNADGEKARRAAAEAAVDDMLHWFEDRSNTVAILDATNSTKSRRKWISERLRAAGIEGPYYKLRARLGDSALTAFLVSDSPFCGEQMRRRCRHHEQHYGG
jgi:hypothetical protein